MAIQDNNNKPTRITLVKKRANGWWLARTNKGFRIIHSSEIIK